MRLEVFWLNLKLRTGFFCSFDRAHLLGRILVRSLKTIFLCVLLGGAFALQAENFELVDGRTVSGELLATSANDLGVQIKTGEGTYEKFTWAEFEQSTLK